MSKAPESRLDRLVRRLKEVGCEFSDPAATFRVLETAMFDAAACGWGAAVERMRFFVENDAVAAGEIDRLIGGSLSSNDALRKRINHDG